MQRRPLSLIAAYQFGRERGLDSEVEEIRNMQIDGFKNKQSFLRRGYIVKLFQDKGLMEEFISIHWPYGGTPQGQKRQKVLLGMYQQHQDILEGGEETEEDAEETEEQRFAYEAHLRDFLSNNLHLIEPGMRLYQDQGVEGIEFKIDSGRIDILAVDSDENLVVIELKLSGGRNKALGQLLYYMGWVDKNMPVKGQCRGVIVAAEITEELTTATRRVAGVSLYQYRLSMILEPVTVNVQEF